MSDEALAAATQAMLMAIILSLILLFGGIVVLVLIHACIVGTAFRRGFSNGTMVERGSAGSASMSRQDLDKLPCYDYIAKEERSRSSPVDCAVCLENFKMGEKCRLLPICKHSFHALCVDAWLLKTPICPICRTSAESWKGGLVSGEGSSHLSNLSQTTGSSHLSEIRIELTESPIIESSRQSDIGIELRENHLNDAGIESGESQANTVGRVY